MSTQPCGCDDTHKPRPWVCERHLEGYGPDDSRNRNIQITAPVAEPTELLKKWPMPIAETTTPFAFIGDSMSVTAKSIPVLDHGYVRFIESWGSDERIIEAARMSTDKGFLGWTFEDGTERDVKLLRYLYEHKHMTPFEMAGMTIEVQAPIFVFREWHRHRTQSYNELSARYSELPDMCYLPDFTRAKASRQHSVNKQSSAEGFTTVEAVTLQEDLRRAYAQARSIYESLLSRGVAREIARLVIPVAQYSRMRASANLRNWLAFLTLRMDPGAQWETQQYANTVGAIIAQQFPRTWALFQTEKP